MPEHDFNRLLADAVRDMADEPTMTSTLDRAVEMAVELVGHCEMAGISVVDGGEIRTVAASSESLRVIDQLQFDLGEGPCFDALREDAVITVGDLATDARWPKWGPQIADQVGLCSSISYRLFTSGQSLGALNLYAGPVHAFTHENVTEGHHVAAHASAAAASALKEAQLRRALENRVMLGQATGILMERFGLDPDRAFAVMRRVSQNHNIKLADIARHLVDTGVLLDRGPHDTGTP